MATRIEWADETWNPTLGCTRVSTGCEDCYAIRTARIRASNPHPGIAAAYAGLVERVDDRLDWTGRVNLLPERLDIPLRWRRRRRIFVDSQTDLFHDQVPDEFIARVFAVMAATPQHTYLLLTKRHGRMRSLLNNQFFRAAVRAKMAADDRPAPGALPWPLPNLHLGVSVEDQRAADLRIPALLATPAAVRWLSLEPLIGPVDLGRWLPDWDDLDRAWVCQEHGMPECRQTLPCQSIDWVVVGGEDGPRARPMHPAWARMIRDQCQHTGVPFLFKQWGAWGPAPWSVRVCDPAIGWTGTDADLAAAKRDAEARGATHCVTLDGHVYEPSHRPWSLERVGDQDGAMRRWGKKAAGRRLDGVEHDEYPPAVTA